MFAAMRERLTRSRIVVHPTRWIALLFCAAAGMTWAETDNAGQIQALCAARFAQDQAAQTSCRDRQHAAASKLMDRIELVAPGSRGYKAASACIERAKIAQPAQIDWPRALRCYENRRAGPIAKPGVE